MPANTEAPLLTRAAFRAGLVVSLDALAATAVVLCEVRAHGGHHDAVAKLQAANAAGLEEGGKGVVLVHIDHSVEGAAAVIVRTDAEGCCGGAEDAGQ